jgi:hypothetical protein
MRSPAPVEVDGLTQHYGGRAVLTDVSFRVPAGTVTGFLGPNGAGKSTTMRALVGLARPRSGTAHVLGGPYGALRNPGLRTGVLLDAGAQHVGRTGLEVLRIGASYLGLPAARAEELLDRVGLSADEARRRVGRTSGRLAPEPDAAGSRRRWPRRIHALPTSATDVRLAAGSCRSRLRRDPHGWFARSAQALRRPHRPRVQWREARMQLGQTTPSRSWSPQSDRPRRQTRRTRASG